MKLTVGSLFSGCGGLDLGFEGTGYDIKWQCEIDKWCRKILEVRFPGVTIHDDANNLYNAEKVDILIGGFPCQPVSAAGRKDGINDPRWLWPAFDRAIRHIRPQYVVVENVPGLFNRGFGDVLGSLALSGYDAEWYSLQSSDVGAPHRRKRVYILASDTRSERRREECRSAFSDEESATGRSEEDDYLAGSISPSRFQAAAIANSISGRFKKRQQGWKLQLFGEDNEESPDANIIRREGIETSYGEDRGMEVERRDDSDRRYSYATDSDSQYDDWAWTPGQRGWGESSDSYFGDYEPAVRRWEQIFREVPNPKDEKGRISVELVEWMMGYPENWTEGVSRTQRLKMLGNSVQVQCAEVVANLLKEKVLYE